ncbi:type II toxin-antitoxin system RelE/ParE family toxin [Phenylobacterium sp.]|uniref:type II toxin-antitoxin system RelE/ParE family toxin n=1 Tax=Phenylobacterium sp. TaxID=1871053 RepID=UPI00301D6BD0
MIVTLADRAAAELDSAVAFIREANPRAAGALHLAIERALDSLETLPDRGRSGAIDGTRELVVHGVPYVIVYRVAEETVFVIRIRHTSQDPSPSAGQA